ncbi:hypothetical protein IQ215_02745 [Cyanobacterium stanieri LEGE 03274]|uniref:Uncharacterized protein n=1 Tax=Cyanobacterium stanieri LEGE 03274 TaxID=1828756 RepID=A0ABR9V143_9CHRO|nr:hypothetical protein [Cyanobacterium stanieri]MBE9221606.1 hypothetical protein [Cyanobacterium stanieri LEGE 03274]
MNKISRNLSIEEVHERMVQMSSQLAGMSSILHHLLLDDLKKHPVDVYLRFYLNLRNMRQYMSEVSYWIMENHPEWFVEEFPQNPFFQKLLDEKQKNSPEIKSNKE